MRLKGNALVGLSSVWFLCFCLQAPAVNPSSFMWPSDLGSVKTPQQKSDLSRDLRAYIVDGMGGQCEFPGCPVMAQLEEQHSKRRRGSYFFNFIYYRSNLEMDHRIDVRDSDYAYRLCNLDLNSIAREKWQSEFARFCEEAAVCRLLCRDHHPRPGRPRKAPKG